MISIMTSTGNILISAEQLDLVHDALVMLRKKRIRNGEKHFIRGRKKGEIEVDYVNGDLFIEVKGV